MRGRIETGSLTTGCAPVFSRCAPLLAASSEAESAEVEPFRSSAALPFASGPGTKGRVTSVDFTLACCDEAGDGDSAGSPTRASAEGCSAEGFGCDPECGHGTGSAAGDEPVVAASPAVAGRSPGDRDASGGADSEVVEPWGDAPAGAVKADERSGLVEACLLGPGESVPGAAAEPLVEGVAESTPLLPAGRAASDALSGIGRAPEAAWGCASNPDCRVAELSGVAGPAAAGSDAAPGPFGPRAASEAEVVLVDPPSAGGPDG